MATLSLKMMPCAQDHKRAFPMDKGLNTGGMGVFALVPGVSQDLLDLIREKCLVPVLQGMKKRSTTFVGVLFAGIMVTQAGPAVLEFNTRFGDPETQAVLPLLRTDLMTVIEACLSGNLRSVEIEWAVNLFSVNVVACSEGYPGSYEVGKVISGMETVEKNPNVHLFKSAVKEGKTCGGRFLSVTGIALTLEAAAATAYNALDCIQFEGKFSRFDIAAKAFTPLKIAVLGSTRGTSLQGILDAIKRGLFLQRARRSIP